VACYNPSRVTTQRPACSGGAAQEMWRRPAGCKSAGPLGRALPAATPLIALHPLLLPGIGAPGNQRHEMLTSPTRQLQPASHNHRRDTAPQFSEQHPEHRAIIAHGTRTKLRLQTCSDGRVTAHDDRFYRCARSASVVSALSTLVSSRSSRPFARSAVNQPALIQLAACRAVRASLLCFVTMSPEQQQLQTAIRHLQASVDC